MLKKAFLVLILAAYTLFTSSCDDRPQWEIDQELIEQYVSDHNINATKHESGLWYEIRKSGGSIHPNVNSKVNVDYVGTLLDGTEFDSGDNVDMILSKTITGWQIGIPLIGEGGKILLIIPSNLGYGPHDQGSVPANSVMVFEVTLNFVAK
jgi:FKBP-type peptidyl-prolyl cis-trans isomerase FkpA